MYLHKIFLLTVILCMNAAQADNELRGWLQGPKNHNEVLQYATQGEKPILVYFYTDWCPYCKRLNKDYISSPEFQELTTGFYRVQINPEKSKSGNKLFKYEYGGTGFPSVYVYIPKISKYRNILSPFFKDGDLTQTEYVQLISESIARDYNNKAFSYYKLKKYKITRDYLLKSLTYDMNNKYTLLLLSSPYQQEGFDTGNKQLINKAKLLYEKILILYPGDKEALTALRDLNS